MELIGNLKLKFFTLKNGFANNRLLKNIISMFVLRGGNIGIQLLIIPVSISFVSPSSYGLWLTISSMIAWLNIMDIGLSAGLRNKLSECISKGDYDLGKSYVSTTYAILAMISLGGVILCGALIYLLDWHTVLTIPADLKYGALQKLLVIVAVSFFLTFLLKPIASIAYALHKPATEYFIIFLSNAINLLAVWIATMVYTKGSLLILAFIFCFTPIFVTLILSYYFFKGAFKQFSPSISTINFKYGKDLTGLSLKFFVVQISATVVFTTNNFMISHYFGNYDVTQYNIVSKYFNVLIILQSMILVPFWTMFTEFFAKKDQVNIKRMMGKLFRMAWLFTLASFVMIIISGIVYKVWIGKLITIPLYLTISVAVFTVMTIFAGVLSTFLNGTGRITFQTYMSFVTSVLHIPLAILVINYFHAGLIGLVSVSTFWLVITMPLKYIQYKKLSSFKYDSGIWVS